MEHGMLRSKIARIPCMSFKLYSFDKRPGSLYTGKSMYGKCTDHRSLRSINQKSSSPEAYERLRGSLLFIRSVINDYLTKI